MPVRRMVRLAVSVALLLSVVTSVIWISDPATLAAAASEIVLSSIALVALFLLGGAVLSSLRLKLITSDLGYSLSFRDAAMTMSVGQLAGTAFFQLAGQLIGRGAVMSRRGIPAAATVIISGYERVVALSVSLLLAAAGALYLFGTLSVDLASGGLSLIKLTVGMAAVMVAGALLAWGRTVVNLARKLTRELLLRLVRSFLISLAIQGTTLAAYVALENALAPHIGIASLAAASCIVMLAASLPISFGGWGLRELSAVVALQAIGLSSASALLIALLIGLLSLLVLAGMAMVIMVGWEPNARPQDGVARPAAFDYAAALDWLLPLMAATAVFFQIYIPTGVGRISVNLADPVIILGASLFVLHHIGKGWPVWRVPHVGLWTAALSAVILLSILRGWLSFGWTDWAFVNKGLGWPILLCYAATGALIIRRAQERGLEILLKTFAASGAAIAIVEIGFTILSRLGIGWADGLVESRIAGLSQNPNAFAFMLLLALAAALVLQRSGMHSVGLMAAALVGLWFTGSRAAFIACPVVLAMAWMLGVALRPLLTALLAAVAVVAGIAAVPLLPQMIEATGWIGAGRDGAAPVVLHLLSRSESVNAQHLQTIVEGLALFMAHPVFGAGLGAYLQDQIRSAGEPLVIHSTAVWLLAETGLIGFGVFLAAACRLFADAMRHRGDPAAFMLILIFGVLAVMSLAHEMLYQRAFWLLLGAALAMPLSAVRR